MPHATYSFTNKGVNNIMPEVKARLNADKFAT